jgi:hypothetical protein
MVARPPGKSHRSNVDDDLLRRRAPAGPRYDATNYQRMQGRAPEIRRLTVVLLDCSTGSMVVRDGRIVEDSDEHRRKGTAEIGRLRPPLLDSFGQDAPFVEADLQSLTSRPRVTSSDGGRSWPELGFTVVPERSEREKGSGFLGFPRRRCTFYRRRRAAASILAQWR